MHTIIIPQKNVDSLKKKVFRAKQKSEIIQLISRAPGVTGLTAEYTSDRASLGAGAWWKSVIQRVYLRRRARENWLYLRGEGGQPECASGRELDPLVINVI